MWNLAIECSGQAASLALVDHGETSNGPSNVVEFPKGGSSVQFVTPMAKDLLQQAKITRPDMISVTTGPGSFTGLRVGIATAKMLAYAWGIRVAAVDSLEAIALEMASSKTTANGSAASPPHLMVPVINAFRRQVFSGLWLADGAQLTEIASSNVVDAADWQKTPVEVLLEAGGGGAEVGHLPVVVGGPALGQYPPSNAAGRTLSEVVGYASGETVAQLGYSKHTNGQLVEPGEVVPAYGRKSAAEEKAG